MNHLVTIDIDVIRLAKEVRQKQKRYFFLANNARDNPDLLAERKEVLLSCKNKERELDMHLDNILSWPQG